MICMKTEWPLCGILRPSSVVTRHQDPSNYKSKSTPDKEGFLPPKSWQFISNVVATNWLEPQNSWVKIGYLSSHTANTVMISYGFSLKVKLRGHASPWLHELILRKWGTFFWKRGQWTCMIFEGLLFSKTTQQGMLFPLIMKKFPIKYEI